MTTQNFLVEIGTEELPPKALKTLATSFADNVEAELNILRKLLAWQDDITDSGEVMAEQQRKR